MIVNFNDNQVNIICNTLLNNVFTKECFCQYFDLWPADKVVVGSVLSNTAGSGVFSTSFMSPYRQWAVDKL